MLYSHALASEAGQHTAQDLAEGGTGVEPHQAGAGLSIQREGMVVGRLPDEDQVLEAVGSNWGLGSAGSQLAGEQAEAKAGRACSSEAHRTDHEMHRDRHEPRLQTLNRY